MKTWKTKDGKELKPEEMTDSHILNSWRLFGQVENNRSKFLFKEAKKRKLTLPEADTEHLCDLEELGFCSTCIDVNEWKHTQRKSFRKRKPNAKPESPVVLNLEYIELTISFLKEAFDSENINDYMDEDSWGPGVGLYAKEAEVSNRKLRKLINFYRKLKQQYETK